MKTLLKKHAPKTYKLLCRIKDRIKPPRRTWGKYYDPQPTHDFLFKPESCLVALKPKIPKNIDTVLNLGCGAGRDFIPFEGELNLWGLDIVPAERIHWLRPFEKLVYTHSYIEDFTRRLERGDYDLTNVLVYSHATLMYLSKKEQERFFAACKKAGATAFIFSEYRSYHDGNYFKLDECIFPTILQFRPEGEHTCFTTLV